MTTKLETLAKKADQMAVQKPDQHGALCRLVAELAREVRSLAQDQDSLRHELDSQTPWGKTK